MVNVLRWFYLFYVHCDLHYFFLQTEALVRIDEVESREAQLEHKEKRLQEEKQFYENQIKLMESELEKQREDLLTSKREAGQKLAELSQVLFQKNYDIYFN